MKLAKFKEIEERYKVCTLLIPYDHPDYLNIEISGLSPSVAEWLMELVNDGLRSREKRR